VQSVERAARATEAPARAVEASGSAAAAAIGVAATYAEPSRKRKHDLSTLRKKSPLLTPWFREAMFIEGAEGDREHGGGN
jgi:hypothetical protein